MAVYSGIVVTNSKAEYTKLLQQRIKEVLQENAKLFIEKDDTGEFFTSIYADYNDELCDETIKKIMGSETPMDYFYETVDGMYEEADWSSENEVVEMLMEDEKIKELLDKINNEDVLRDLLREVFYVVHPYKHYLDQKVKVDIIVDTGDLNHDYTLNCVYPHYNGREDDEIDNHASIVWLSEQQGYTKEDLEKALKVEEYKDSKFLKSMEEEVANCSTHMNALVFCVEMALEDIIKLNERMQKEKELNNSYDPNQRTGTDFIKLDKKTTCGLYDCWNGAGSMLEIELEKDITLPIKFIDTALPDGCRGSSIESIYNPTNIWNHGSLVL